MIYFSASGPALVSRRPRNGAVLPWFAREWSERAETAVFILHHVSPPDGRRRNRPLHPTAALIRRFEVKGEDFTERPSRFHHRLSSSLRPSRFRHYSVRALLELFLFLLVPDHGEAYDQAQCQRRCDFKEGDGSRLEQIQILPDRSAQTEEAWATFQRYASEDAWR